MSSFITQCPHCQTRFRLSDAQLGVARGLVRCGACMELFNAKHSLQPDTPPADEQPSTPLDTERAALDTVTSSEPPAPAALDLDNLDLDEELAKLQAEEQQQPEPQDEPLPSEPTAPLEPAVETEPDDTRQEPTLVAATEEEPPAPPPANEQPAATRTSRVELEDDPLQLDWRKPRKPWGRWLLWGTLNLLALLALAGQYVVYNFEELARQEQYRPWLERLCPELGCEVPSRVDIGQIKSSNLVVRSHPEFTSALVVDAILYNRADFPQPFPLLEIRFADLNGTLLASRTFKPGEYLAGELAGQTEMPSQVPIHIALDILDPGANAVNYSLHFHSPE
ncbi:DUF3426 domain-containing protein [Pseudomonas sp. ABC1]|uniref:DUF3426 domain-containing protein n=1 Tax=Pseudomonas sp. ABC1 TaxID=2748080 RepID=UPI0015C345AB|nr:DUF3426 domain-containing protein [Pseudomonas sp. ABC1]QLF93065.1 DUF3426 domain-containing protein [Pseudomonas sp. ABC1]